MWILSPIFASTNCYIMPVWIIPSLKNAQGPSNFPCVSDSQCPHWPEPDLMQLYIPAPYVPHACLPQWAPPPLPSLMMDLTLLRPHPTLYPLKHTPHAAPTPSANDRYPGPLTSETEAISNKEHWVTALVYIIHDTLAFISDRDYLFRIQIYILSKSSHCQ